MERHASALKAARQAAKRQVVNRAALSKCKTVVRNLRAALAEKTKSKEELKKKVVPLLSEVQRTLRKAASKNLIKKGNASRTIARLSHQVHTSLNA